MTTERPPALGTEPVRDLAAALARRAGPDPTAGSRGVALALAALFALVAGMHFLLARRLNVNWDEFHYLSYVYEAARGDLHYAWATLHVHLFGWLTRVEGTEVDRVMAARLVYLAIELAAAGLLYRVARRFHGREAALMVVLAYLSFSYVLRHGTSFRPDPLCAALLLLALDRLLPPHGRLQAALAGMALGLSTAITIKATLHVALVFAVMALLVAASPALRRPLARRAGALCLGAVASFGFFTLLHRATLVPASEANSAPRLTAAAAKVLDTGSFLPRRRVALAAFDENPLFWLLIAAGVALLAGRLLRGRSEERSRALLLLLLFLPVASIAIYRNAFPYFYVFVLPTVVLVAGEPIERAALRARRGRPLLWRGLIVVLALAIVSEALATTRTRRPDETAVQRQLLEVVHRMFPEPVAYIDRCSMVSSFPKVGFFMSSWGLQRYRETGVPSFRALLAEQPVPFLIANTISLRLDLPDRVLAGHPYSLLREDLALIRDNFVHHWGLIFVQGKRLDFAAQPGPLEFEILSGGPFTLEAEGAVEIDGAVVTPGTTVELAAGRHVAVAAEGTRGAILRWGERLWRPDFPPLTDPIFLDL